jgi:hypothetical protein
VGQQLSTDEMAAYYAGRRYALAGRRGGARTEFDTKGEQAAFALGYRHLRDEQDSRLLLAECRRMRRQPSLEPTVSPMAI